MFLSKGEDAIGEVAQDVIELGIDLLLEVFEAEVGILSLRRICREIVSEIFTIEILHELIHPDRPIAAGGDLLAFEVHEFICGNVVRETIALILTHEHCRPDQCMKDDVIFANEVHHFGLFIQPIVFPFVRIALHLSPFNGRRNIADGRIKPDV